MASALAAEAVPVTTSQELADIPLELLDVGENVRVDPGNLEELTASIAELGVLQPIRAIGPDPGGRYRAVWGQRRILASIAAGLDTIPALVEGAADVDKPGARRSIEQLAENLQRKDLNAIEEAVALREVLDADAKLTQAELATKLGRSPSWLSNTLRLLETDEVVQDGVRRGAITASHAKALVVLPAAEQRSLAERIEKGMSAHELESTLRWKLAEVEQREATRKRTEKAIPKAIAALEAAGVEKGVEVYIQGQYNLDTAPLATAIKKAGWSIRREYAFDRGDRAKCDCQIVRMEFNRVWKITPACKDDKHRDRQRNVDNKAEQERRAAIAERVGELRTRVRAALEQVPVPLLLLAHGDTWALPGLVERAAGVDPAELRDLVASAMADRADASRVYNDRRESLEKALETLIGMLDPAEAPAS